MKILLVQTSFLGDVILSTPVIAALKKLNLAADLFMLTTPQAAELVRRDPLLSGVLVFDKRSAAAGVAGLWRVARELRKAGFDRVYALHRSCRTGLLLWLSRIPARVGFREACLSRLYHPTVPRATGCHDVLRNLSLLSGEAPPESFEGELRLFAPSVEELSSEVRGIVRAERDYVVVVPGSAWYTKMWHAEGYRQLVSYLLEKGQRVVLLGSQSEETVGRSVAQGQDVSNLIGLCSVGECMAVVKHAKLVVCNDSMALHMASAFKVPTVAVFCATSPDFGFGPWRNQALVVEKKGLACKPCRRHGGHACPNSTEACMRELACAEVISAVEQLVGI